MRMVRYFFLLQHAPPPAARPSLRHAPPPAARPASRGTPRLLQETNPGDFLLLTPARALQKGIVFSLILHLSLMDRY